MAATGRCTVLYDRRLCDRHRGALQLDALVERLKAEYGLDVSFETTRFTLCRWLTGPPAEIDKFAKAHGASMAEDFDASPVFKAPSAWDINCEAEGWPEVKFVDVKDYQREHQH